MKVALVGYGAMGREIEPVLAERGHQATLVRRNDDFPRDCVVGIDFTRADAVPGNVAAAMAAGARYVVGTTGWHDRLADVRGLVEHAGGGFVHGANFSIGVGLFYRIVREAARVMATFPDYDPYVLERHHRRKRDAPSGTARVLAEMLASASAGRRRPVGALDGPLPEAAFHVASLRAGGIVGDHTVGFDAGTDEISIEHRARSRRGFALGAVRAAEWIAGRSGFYNFEAVLEDIGEA